MISLKGWISIPFLKKSDFKGSYCGMRYRLSKINAEQKDQIQAQIWKGPKSYDQTEEEMETEQFPFSAQGIEEAVSWLNEKYKEKKALWDHVTYR